MRKILSMILAFSLCLSLCTAIVPEAHAATNYDLYTFKVWVADNGTSIGCSIGPVDSWHSLSKYGTANGTKVRLKAIGNDQYYIQVWCARDAHWVTLYIFDGSGDPDSGYDTGFDTSGGIYFISGSGPDNVSAAVWTLENGSFCTKVGSTKYVLYIDNNTYWPFRLSTNMNHPQRVNYNRMTLSPHSHTAGTPTQQNKVAATCTTDGSYVQVVKCSGCGIEMSRSTITIPASGHSLEKTEATPATCTEAGNNDYWTCSVCDKVFSDEAGTQETTVEDQTLPKTGHNLTKTEAKAATCKDTGIKAHWHCSACKKDFSDAAGTAELTDITVPKDDDNHVGGTEVRDAKEATYKDEGYTGDTYCLGCDAKIADGTSIPKKTHSHSDSSDKGSSTYAIIIKCDKHGSVTSDRSTASRDTTVTLTVKPDKGYTLETLTVTDKNGNELKIKEKNGKYTFTMPASRVTVEATFMEDNSMLNFFVDVPADAYYYDAVLWAAENGITGGTDAMHFSPNATCTRAQAVTFLWRAAGSPEPKSIEMPFEDVAGGAYYYDAVLWAVENGITAGTTATTFSPNNNCTRAQIVTFLWRSQKSPAGDAVNPFTDVAVEAYYYDAVLWAVEEGVTAGTTATTFSPNNNCTRAQIVTFLYRALNSK